MRMNSCLITAGLAWLLLTPPVFSRPGYVSLVPNGDVNSCSTCHEGPPILNPFGSDFLAAGFSWTPALAALDSDGDGFTNGQELGDPKGTGTPIPGASVALPGDPSSKPALTPPNISITSPANGATFPAPFTGAIAATTTNAPESIVKVDFYSGTTLLGTASAPPFSFTVNSLAAGSYSLTAKATDYLGATNVSAAVAITVTGAPANITLTFVKQNGTNGVLTWTGGASPYVVQKKASLSDSNWVDLVTTTDPIANVPLDGPSGFLRLKD